MLGKPARASTYTSEHTRNMTQQPTISIHPPTPAWVWHYWLDNDPHKTCNKRFPPMNSFSFNPLAAQEDSSPSKTQANQTHCSNETSTPNHLGYILLAVHTPSSPALHNPGGFPGRHFLACFQLYMVFSPHKHLPNPHLHFTSLQHPTASNITQHTHKLPHIPSNPTRLESTQYMKRPLQTHKTNKPHPRAST
jgi:hypothetical protein